MLKVYSKPCIDLLGIDWFAAGIHTHARKYLTAKRQILRYEVPGSPGVASRLAGSESMLFHGSLPDPYQSPSSGRGRRGSNDVCCSPHIVALCEWVRVACGRECVRVGCAECQDLLMQIECGCCFSFAPAVPEHGWAPPPPWTHSSLRHVTGCEQSLGLAQGPLKLWSVWF